MNEASAQEHCRRLAQRHYENFPVASLLLPRRLRAPVVAIYAFARSADDIADEGDWPPAERLARLNAYGAQLDRLARGAPPEGPVFEALARAVARHRLPLAPFHDLLSAFRQDVTTTRYADAAAVADYCRRSANPIGRLLLHLYGVDSAPARRWSDAICTGLQRVNFLQDLRGDYARGRVYLPQDRLRRHGVTEAQLRDGRVDDAWRALIVEEIGHARRLLRHGVPLIARLPRRAAWELRFTLAGGLRVLDKIDAATRRGQASRARLTPADWGIIAARALMLGRTRASPTADP